MSAELRLHPVSPSEPVTECTAIGVTSDMIRSFLIRLRPSKDYLGERFIKRFKK